MTCRFRPVTILALSVIAATAATSGGASADTPPPRRITVLEAEISGDLTDPVQSPHWPARLKALTGNLRGGLQSNQLYTVVPLGPTLDAMAPHAGRHEVHACAPCLQSIAESTGSDRILAAWVFRMSQLVLTLHIEIWDTKTGQRLLYKMLNFRGDNDTGWDRATKFFIDELKQLPSPP